MWGWIRRWFLLRKQARCAHRWPIAAILNRKYGWEVEIKCSLCGRAADRKVDSLSSSE